MPTNDKSHRAESLPRAKVKKGWQVSPIWVAPILAAGLLGWLLTRTFLQAGPTITIHFKDAKGIEVKNTMVKYRGAKIGEVTAIKLTKDRQYVEVKAQLERSAASVATEGSQFWIVRPEVSVGEIRGLTTRVSG